MSLKNLAIPSLSEAQEESHPNTHHPASTQRIPLLMTASIHTRGMENARFLPHERENMYKNTLLFYLRKLQDGVYNPIIFVENSGWNLDRLRNAIPLDCRSEVEFLAFEPEHFSVSKGKGYNEVLLIQKAIEQSQILQRSPGFLKVTGRYPIHNIDHFLKVAEKELILNKKEVFIDIKDHDLYAKLGLGWCSRAADVRLFGASNHFFLEQVASRIAELNDQEGKLLEGLMYNLVKARMHSSQLVYRFSREPHYGGREGSLISAFSFAENHNSLKGHAKRWLGNVLRRVAPNFLF